VNNRVIFTKSMGLSLGVGPYVFPLDVLHTDLFYFFEIVFGSSLVVHA
jgi:hypothetical protein